MWEAEGYADRYLRLAITGDAWERSRKVRTVVTARNGATQATWAACSYTTNSASQFEACANEMGGEVGDGGTCRGDFDPFSGHLSHRLAVRSPDLPAMPPVALAPFFPHGTRESVGALARMCRARI